MNGGALIEQIGYIPSRLFVSVHNYTIDKEYLSNI